MSLQSQIESALSVLEPMHLELTNESDMHRGPPNRETHFKLVIVSDVFVGLSRVARQQKINGLLGFAFKSGLHALTMKVMTGDEWKNDQSSFQSPDCAHKKLR
ncbi:MAG: BolA family transcriptional regulator [Bdellovibrionales bacterium]|nr:BolA family transcriptional regulator [Bdellovibrionales bacterium]